MIGKLLSWTLQIIRPLLGPSNICPFPTGCTQYAIHQLETQHLGTALVNITKRLLQCHPFKISRFKKNKP